MYEEKFAQWVAKIGGLHPMFVHVPIHDVPLSSLRVPLSACRLALVTTGGVHRKDQPAFDEWNEGGDSTYREIPDQTPTKLLKISHVHYNHDGADRDINCIFPLDRIHELQQEGIIGSTSPIHFSFMGYIPDPREMFTKAAPAVAQALKDNGVDAILMTSG
jgi:D-proline reductase (dithiol) PrdB